MTTQFVSNVVPEAAAVENGHRGVPAGDSAWATPNLPRFSGVSTRLLRPDERAPAAQFPALPLVLEAQGNSSQAFLEGFLREHSEAVIGAIHDYGGVLLRGFQVMSDRQFESAISSVPAFRPMDGYFMAEEGRTPVRPGSKVFHTNTVVRTGGGFKLPGRGFHTENYYSTDVPAFICFWCQKPGWHGGETAISLLSRAYSQLDEVTRRRVESKVAYQVRLWSLDAIARRYGVSAPIMQGYLEALGLPALEVDGQLHVSLVKPAIVQHPRRARKCLQLNLSTVLPGFNEATVERFLPSYSSWPWAPYRQAWKRPALNRAGQILTNLTHVFASREAVHHYLLAGWSRWVSKQPAVKHRPPAEGFRISEKLNAEDIRALADAVWRHSSVFTWKPGDVLILDNLQVAHTGMPGWGPREVRAMLCNPVRFLFEPDGGVANLEVSSEYRSIFDRLSELLDTAPSAGQRADAA